MAEATVRPAARTEGAAWFSQARLTRLSDYLVVATAASLPWSTSATSILLVLWLIALLPTLDLAALRDELLRPAGGLPVLLWMFAALGMLWANVTWAERLYGLRYYHKFLVIPLLLVQFRRSEIGWYALVSFGASCAALLALSWMLKLWPPLSWSPERPPGVPVKDRIVQGTEFIICAAALAHVALDQWKARRWQYALALALVIFLLLANVGIVSLARTALVVAPCLFILVGYQRYGLKGATALLAAGAIFAGVVWTVSPSLRERVGGSFQEVSEFRDRNPFTNAGLRLEYWRQSLALMSEAPLIGNGTGSARSLSVETLREEGRTLQTAMPNNPHNQALAVGVQLGVVGIILLFAMWIAHFELFRGAQLACWLGTLLVVQNALSSLLNSHLFDFTPGWIYVLGVGVLGGMVSRQKASFDLLARGPAKRI